MIQLYKHQKEALARYRYEKCIPLLMSCGTGKTMTTLALAHYKFVTGQIDTMLVIAPNGVHEQWATGDIPKYFEDKDDIEYVVTYKKVTKLEYVPYKLNIVCVNIETFSTEKAWRVYRDFAIAHNTFLVLDEATRIKHPESKRSQRLLYEFNKVEKKGRTIVSSIPLTVCRAALTGTAITNSPFDAWSLFEFLSPGYWKMGYKTFCEHYGMYRSINVSGRTVPVLIDEASWKGIHYCKTYADALHNFGVVLSTYDIIKNQTRYEGSYKNLDKLRDKLQESSMIVRLEDVQDMPEQVYIKREIEMTREQEKAYKDLVKEFMTDLPDGDIVEVTSLLVAYMKLQQVTSGFIIKNKEFQEDPKPAEVHWFNDTPPKLEALLNDIEEADKPVIVATKFTCEAELIYNRLVQEGYRVCLMTGWKKIGTIEQFQKGEYDVMVANIRVMSMGFNLQNACYMMYYSNTFSLEDRIQSEGRIWRTGQRNKCFYYDYVCKGTIDDKIAGSLRSKKSVADFIQGKTKEDLL